MKEKINTKNVLRKAISDYNLAKILTENGNLDKAWRCLTHALQLLEPYVFIEDINSLDKNDYKLIVDLHLTIINTRKEIKQSLREENKGKSI